MASNGSSAKSSKEMSDKDGFTLQLSGQNVEPDLMLAATDKECREVSSTQLSALAGRAEAYMGNYMMLHEPSSFPDSFHGGHS